MLSRIAATAAGTAALLGVPTVPAAAAGGGGHSSADPDCGGSNVVVTVCAAATSSTPGSGGSGAPAAHHGQGGSGTDASKCSYSKLTPQPPANNLAMQDGKRMGGKGAVYQVWCDSGRFGVVWIPDGAAPAQPAVDPETLARRAADSMTLRGPDIASPRAAGRYTVGVPMWLWVRQSATTYGPTSASASAGGIAVTATARVTSIRWTMGDGTTFTCTGPGTPYRASDAMTDSPDCGHRYSRTSAGQPGIRFPLTSTSTWTITWHVDGTETDAGQWTETRTSTLGVSVGEAQVVNQ